MIWSSWAGFLPWRGKDFFFVNSVKPIQWIAGAVSPALNRLEREEWWSYISTPLCTFMVYCLIN
jgi:hypothetical protein